MTPDETQTFKQDLIKPFQDYISARIGVFNLLLRNNNRYLTQIEREVGIARWVIESISYPDTSKEELVHALNQQIALSGTSSGLIRLLHQSLKMVESRWPAEAIMANVFRV